MYPDQLVEGSLEPLVFVPVEQDVSIGWDIEHVLDDEDRVHGHVDLTGGLGVVQLGGLLVPVASHEASTHDRGVGHHHDPTEGQEQHDGGVFVTEAITSTQKIFT